MGKQQSQNKPFKPSDYNEPTEPLELIPLPSYAAPPYGVDNAFPTATTVPAPPSYVPEARPGYPYHQPSQAGYPVSPPSSRKKQRGYPPGGAVAPYEPLPRRRYRRSPLPGLVRLGFILVQLILLFRVVCLVFEVQNTTLWLSLLFAAGDLFVQPARLLAANINLSVLAGTPLLLYLEFLVAIFAYGLFSRLLALFLRALLN